MIDVFYLTRNVECVGSDVLMSQKFMLAATGETLCTRRSSCYTDERFLGLVKLLRSADCTFTNLETPIHTFKGYPNPSEVLTGTYQQADPYVADELKWMGFNLIALANNHAADYSHEMLFEEMEILDKAGLVHAGVGKNLSEATMPAYLETEKGRAALISLCADHPPLCSAGEQRRDMHGRPGINPIRYDEHYVLDADSYEGLRRICSALGIKRGVGEKEIRFLKNRFELGNKPAVIREVRKLDVERNIRAVKDARRAADYVFVSYHHHSDQEQPAPMVQDISRKLIDAGADAIIGHGPHVIQGIEIYKKKPIFYSLGNFFYQSDTIKRFPSEMYEKMGLGVDDTPQDVLDMRELVRSGKVRGVGGYDSNRGGEWFMRWHETLLASCTFES